MGLFSKFRPKYYAAERISPTYTRYFYTKAEYDAWKNSKRSASTQTKPQNKTSIVSKASNLYSKIKTNVTTPKQKTQNSSGGIFSKIVPKVQPRKETSKINFSTKVDKGSAFAKRYVELNGEKKVSKMPKSTAGKVLRFIGLTLLGMPGVAVRELIDDKREKERKKLEEQKRKELEEQKRKESEERSKLDTQDSKYLPPKPATDVHTNGADDNYTYLDIHENVDESMYDYVDHSLYTTKDKLRKALHNEYESHKLEGESFADYCLRNGYIDETKKGFHPDSFDELDVLDHEIDDDIDMEVINHDNLSCDGKVVNWNSSGYPDDIYSDGYSTNCAYCTLAYEYRQRGYDVEASAIFQMTSNTKEVIESWYEDGKFETFETSRPSVSDLKDMFDLSGSGNNSRGQLCIMYAFGGGHSMAYEIDESGNVLVRDCQRNIKMTLEELCEEQGFAMSEVNIMRTDNLELSEKSLVGVKNREEGN